MKHGQRNIKLGFLNFTWILDGRMYNFRMKHIKAIL